MTDSAARTSEGRWRPALWALVILLSTILLVYPKHFSLEYAPVQSIRVLPNLPLFGGLYYLWFSGLMGLLFMPRKSRLMPSLWEGIAVTILFVLVFRGMWDVVLPDWWVDGLSNIINSQAIVDNGRVPHRIAYPDFPGMHVLAASTAQIAGMDIFATAASMLLLMDALIASFLYLICLTLLNDTRLAALAALLGMLGNAFFAALFFYPYFLGLVLFSAFLDRFVKSGFSNATADRLVAFVLLSGSAIIHFISAAAFGFVLLSKYIVAYLTRRASLSVAGILFAIIAPLAWLIFYARETFHSLVIMGSQVLVNLTRNPLSWVFTVARANLTSSEPFWATGTKLFWLAFLYAGGTLAILVRLPRFRDLTTPLQLAIGAFLGVMVLSVGSTLMSTGGFEFFRLLAFAPLFTAPFLVMLLCDLPSPQSMVGPAAVASAAILLSFPSFLAFHSRVEQYAYYDYEYAAGRFASSVPTATIYGLAYSYLPAQRYNMTARYLTEGQASVDIRSPDYLWVAISRRVAEFQKGPPGRHSLFFDSGRPRVYYQHVFGMLPSDHHWAEMEERLAAADLVYENGYAKFYEREEPAHPESRSP